jgi:preprotein translocase subunit SecE
MSPPDKSKTQPIDVATIYQMLRELRQDEEDNKKRILNAITALSGRIAIAQKDVIDLTGTMKIISTDAASSRLARLQQEIADQEREKKVLEERIRVVDEKLDEKKVATVGVLNTTGKMMAAAELTFEQREDLKKDAAAAVWAKRRELIITAIMVSTSVGIVGSIITAIIWFINFYVSNR